MQGEGRSLWVHVIQHMELEDPGSILEWLTKKECRVTYTKTFKKEEKMECLLSFAEVEMRLEELDMLIVLGGAMNTDEEDRYPWLTQEKQFLRKCLETSEKAGDVGGQKRIVVLGICLGAQL